MTTPYFGTWTIVDSEGNVLTVLPNQDEALTYAQENRKEGGIVSIDAVNCLIELIDVLSTKIQDTQENSHIPKEIAVRRNSPEPMEISDPAIGEIHIHQPDPEEIQTLENSQTHIIHPDSTTAVNAANTQSHTGRSTSLSSKATKFRRIQNDKSKST
ncbi:MAG: hypothetical protein JST44_22075 [Cyanobacteria bacterium SZAS LIN-5]|nr:hypothetical protein [Cyanobacteria bacterium SZAS LIN-5]